MTVQFEFIEHSQASAFTPPEIVVRFARDHFIAIVERVLEDVCPEWYGDFIEGGEQFVFCYWGLYCKLSGWGRE